MNIQILGENFEITDAVRKIINDKFVKRLERHMVHLDEDEKMANMKIEEQSRWGYSVNFDMWLPGNKHIFAEEKNDKLQSAIISLRTSVERQITDYMDKVRIKNSLVSNSN